MTLNDKAELVLEVLRGAEIPALAQARRLPSRTLNRWVRCFLRAGIAALSHEAVGVESRLAPIIPLYPELGPKGKRQRANRRGGR